MMLDLIDNSSVRASQALAGKTTKDLRLFMPIINGFKKPDFKFKQTIAWHGLYVTLHLQSEHFLSEVNNYFPASWLGKSNANLREVNVYMFDDQAQNISNSFWLESDPDCHLYQEGASEWACQRDFLAKKNNDEVVAVCKNSISDGFFNLMRWVLPRFWLSQNQFLFHSSCVLNKNKEAYLCLGPSGAGKTTIAKFLPQSQVLGDDMNLLTVSPEGKVQVTPSLLGQSYESSELFGKNYPLKQLFWITKSNENAIVEKVGLSLRLKVCMSLVNIFWEHLSGQQLKSVQDFILFLNNKYSIKELKFSLDEEVWNYVFSRV